MFIFPKKIFRLELTCINIFPEGISINRILKSTIYYERTNIYKEKKYKTYETTSLPSRDGTRGSRVGLLRRKYQMSCSDS